MTDGAQTAAAAREAVVGLGGGFMISPEAKAAGKTHGYRGWQLYVTGRGGVLGDVPAAVVEAAFGFLHRDLVRFGWDGGRAVAPLPETVDRYVEVCRSWGRARYAGLADVGRLAELLGEVVYAADPAGWPLFAAWQAWPLPGDDAGRASQLLHVLREHRGGAHLGAVRAAGLSPLEAIMAGAGGAGNATFLGWPDPLPTVTDDTRRRLAAAETTTDQLVAPAYAVLDEAAREDLLRILTDAAAAVRRAA